MKYNSLLLFLLLFVIPVNAQDAPLINVRVLCFERIGNTLDRIVVLKEDKSLEEIIFSATFPSSRVKVPVFGGKVTFLDPADPGGKPLARTSIPSGLKDVLIMFFPNPDQNEDATSYKTVAIDASTSGIPEDGALLLNLDTKDVRAVVGEHRIILKPGKKAGLKRPQKRNDYNMTPVVFLQQKNEDWKTVVETLVRFPPGVQQFFVSYPKQGSGKLAIRAFQINDR